MTAVTAVTDAEQAETTERHANNLELFLDLVFVFAITQVAHRSPRSSRIIQAAVVSPKVR